MTSPPRRRRRDAAAATSPPRRRRAAATPSRRRHPAEIALLLEGDGFRRAGRGEDARRCYEKCLKLLFDRAGQRNHGQADVAGLARATLRVGESYYDERDYTKCMASLDRAAVLVEELTDALDSTLRGGASGGADARGDAARVLLERCDGDGKRARAAALTLRGQVELARGRAMVELASYP